MASKMLETWQQWIEAAREDLRLARTLLEEQHDFIHPFVSIASRPLKKH